MIEDPMKQQQQHQRDGGTEMKKIRMTRWECETNIEKRNWKEWKKKDEDWLLHVSLDSCPLFDPKTRSERKETQWMGMRGIKVKLGRNQENKRKRSSLIDFVADERMKSYLFRSSSFETSLENKRGSTAGCRAPMNLWLNERLWWNRMKDEKWKMKRGKK